MSRKYNLSDEFIYKMLEKIRNFELLKKEEHNFYNITPLNKIRNRRNICIDKWYTYNLVRLMRITFIFLNKNKYKVFTYSEMTFWKIASRKKRENIKAIQKYLQKEKFGEERERYFKMSITTINKYDDNYGLFIACVVNRIFYHDLSRNILEYI